MYIHLDVAFESRPAEHYLVEILISKNDWSGVQFIAPEVLHSVAEQYKVKH